MPVSTLTAKGQTTIPKQVREQLHLKPRDKLRYIVEGDAIVMRPMRGSILDLKGIFRGAVKGSIDFKKLREEMKKHVAQRVLKDLR